MKCYKLAKGRNEKAIIVNIVQQSIQYFQRPTCILFKHPWIHKLLQSPSSCICSIKPTNCSHSTEHLIIIILKQINMRGK